MTAQHRDTNTTSHLHAGWSRREIDIPARGYAMFGYGQWTHRARGARTPLYARAIVLGHAGEAPLIFCCLDLGCITHAMRAGIRDRLAVSPACGMDGSGFDESRLVLTATHTHSAPGGCTHDALYNMPTPGFVPAHLAAVVDAACAAIAAALATRAPTDVTLGEDSFAPAVPVAWNRSLDAWNRNPEVVRYTPQQTHLALDRRMQVISLRRDGRTRALLSLFGVHATCVGNQRDLHDGDNKGYAAAQAEATLRAQGADDAVAVFAQGTAGDVSPHYQGPGDLARRKALRGEAEYRYAEQNGRHQSDLALQVLAQDGATVGGRIDSVLAWLDLSDVHADPRFAHGHADARTSEPCHGVAFFRGCRIDGPGMAAPLGMAAAGVARALKAKRLAGIGLDDAQREHYRRLYAAQGDKDVLLEAGSKRILGQKLADLALPDIADPLVGEIKRQARIGAIDKSDMVPSVMPLQIVRIGDLALVCCPGEFTGTAGRRLRESVAERLRAGGISRVLICTYCNDYMGYVTTREEYQLQRYEGGHTLFGQWTLAAFQTGFDRVAAELLKPAGERTRIGGDEPAPPPADELALRSDLPVPG